MSSRCPVIGMMKVFNGVAISLSDLMSKSVVLLQRLFSKIMDLSKWKDIHVYESVDNTVNMTIFPNIQIQQIPIKMLTSFFAKFTKVILKIICTFKGLRKAKTILKEQNWKTHTSPFQN